MPEENQKQYELVCILPPQLEGGDLQNIKKEIETMVQQNAGSINFKEEKKHNLAYPINKQGQGIYIVSQISISSEKISGLSKQLKLNKQVLRHLITQLPIIKPETKKSKPKLITKPTAIKKDIKKSKPRTKAPAFDKPATSRPEEKAKLEEIDKKLDEIIKEI